MRHLRYNLLYLCYNARKQHEEANLVPDAQFTVPYPEHPHFVGREEDLARLHAALQGEGPVGINPAAMGNPTGVTGQGGIGKTQLAVAYACLLYTSRCV